MNEDKKQKWICFFIFLCVMVIVGVIIYIGVDYFTSKKTKNS